MRRYREDYIPGDKKSFSQKYGAGASLINEEDDDLVPEFVKKIFESNNSAPKNEKLNEGKIEESKLNEGKVKKMKESEDSAFYDMRDAIKDFANWFNVSTPEGRKDYIDTIQNAIGEALFDIEQENDVEFGNVVIEL